MATYHVAASGGSDSTNDGLSVGAPFATIQKAFDVVAAGDTIKLLAGTHRIGASLTFTTPGTAGSPIYVDACDGSGNYSETASNPVTVALSASYVSGYILNFGSGTVYSTYYIWRNITFDGAAYSGGGQATNIAYCGTNTPVYNFQRCVFKNASGSGLYLQSGGSMFHCVIESNGSYGIQANTNRTIPSLIECVIRNNTTGGAYPDGGSNFLRCLIYKNGTYGIRYGQYSDNATVTNCTIDGHTYNIYVNTGAGGVIARRCCITNAGTTGIHAQTSSDAPAASECVFYGNTANGNTGVVVDSSLNRFTDPLYTSRSAGTEDYSPSAATSSVYGFSPYSNIVGNLAPLVGAICKQYTSTGGGCPLVGHGGLVL